MKGKKNEREEWQEIDKQIDNNDLNGSGKQHYYSTQKTEPFQYIRIKCIGGNHCDPTSRNRYILALVNFEIFGKLVK